MQIESRFHEAWRKFVLERRAESQDQYRAMVADLAGGHAKYGGKVLRTFFHPYVVGRQMLQANAEAAESVTGVLEKLAKLYLAEAGLRSQFPLDPRVADLIAARPTPWRAAPVLRFDSFVAGGSIRFLEVNTDGSSGMNDTNEIEHRFLQCRVVQRFQEHFRLTMLPMLRRVLETLLAAYAADPPDVPGAPVAEPVIAIVDWKGVKTEEEFFALKECFDAAGHRTLIVDPRKLTFSGGRLRANGQPIDVVYKRVLTSELLARWGEVQPLFEGYRKRAFTQVGSYLGEILYDKGVLAVLSDPKNEGHFDAADREAIARHVPWTRRVHPGRTRYDGKERDLFDLLSRHRERFVVKPATAYGGTGVRIGRETSAADWEKALAAGVSEELVVQEYVDIPSEPFVQIEDGAAVAKKINVGQFVFEGRFGGLYCRVSDASVINVSSGGATLPCFVVDDATTTAYQTVSKSVNLEPHRRSEHGTPPERRAKNRRDAGPKRPTPSLEEARPMAKTVEHVLGLMDPNSLSFRVALEGLIAHLKPEIESGGKSHHVRTRRITCRPYLTTGAKTECSAIVNRGAHWNPHHNSFFQIVAPTVYLLNDMASFKAIDKNTGYGHMHDLGMHIPTTVAIPQKDYSEMKKSPTLDVELTFSEFELFDLKEIGEEVGYPAFIKPQDGGGWVGVKKVENFEELQAAYDDSGSRPQNLQKAIDYTEFVRTVGVGPQMMPMHYNAAAPYSHQRYLRSANQAVAFNWLTPEQEWQVKATCKVINAFYGWDHNSCETLIGKDGIIYPIDFCNAYPDSNLISLHFYFPGLVKAMTKWLLFVTVAGYEKSLSFAYRWKEFHKVRDEARAKNWDWKTTLKKYEAIADEHFHTDRFNAFCDRELGGAQFDKRCLEYFQSEGFDQIIEQQADRYFKIKAELPEQLQHYRGIHAFWCHCEKTRLGQSKA
ncbi:MAG: hypothetical protein HY303_18015 [Candidatus Wallbacteria bacterium]|nr:hypothetical protein [Candidatus Wallbacteria bacterium]